MNCNHNNQAIAYPEEERAVPRGRGPLLLPVLPLQLLDGLADPHEAVHEDLHEACVCDGCMKPVVGDTE